jgi:hypothetical protein
MLQDLAAYHFAYFRKSISWKISIDRELLLLKLMAKFNQRNALFESQIINYQVPDPSTLKPYRGSGTFF